MNIDTPIPVFGSHLEEHTREILVEFEQAGFYNALIDENDIPLSQRLGVAYEPPKRRTVKILGATDHGAIKMAQYHFFMTGSDFKVIEN